MEDNYIDEKNDMVDIEPYNELSEIPKKKKNSKKHFDLDFFEY